MKQKIYSENGITEGVIWKQLLAFFFPILLGTFFQQLYNTADAIIVGKFVGKEALAAVGGSTSTLVNLLVGFFVGLSSGATVIISQYYGARDEKNVSLSVHTAIALGIVCGLIFMVVGILGSPFALKSMGVPEEIMDYSVIYIRIYFAGVIAPLIYNMGAGILRAVGDSRRPLYFLITCCLTNVVLDILFVAVLRMGVVGAALATLLSQILSAVLVMITLMRANRSYRVFLKKIKLEAAMLRNIVRIGFPAGLQSVMYSISNIIIQASINAFGTDIIAAWAAYGKIDGIYWMVLGAFGISITTFVGQNFGAQKYDRVKKSVRICLAMSFGTSVLLSLVLILLGRHVFLLFTDDTFVIQKGVEIMNFMVPFYFTYVCIEILSGAVRGAGDSFVPMVMTALGVCALRIVWIAIAVPVWPDVKTVALSYPITWIVTSLLFIIYYKQGGWLRRSIVKAGFNGNEGGGEALQDAEH